MFFFHATSLIRAGAGVRGKKRKADRDSMQKMMKQMARWNEKQKACV
jgi:hypothetical protein